MNKHHQQSPAPTTAIVIIVVLMLVVVLLAGCVLVGLMFYRNTTHKAMVAREHALKAEAQARKAAEMERERAEQMARAVETERGAKQEIGTVAVTPNAELAVTELRIAFDAEGHMSVDGRAMEWERVKGRLGQLSSHPPSRVVILADERCRMEPVLKLLRAAKECSIETSIGTSQVEADLTD